MNTESSSILPTLKALNDQKGLQLNMLIVLAALNEYGAMTVSGIAVVTGIDEGLIYTGLRKRAVSNKLIESERVRLGSDGKKNRYASALYKLTPEISLIMSSISK